MRIHTLMLFTILVTLTTLLYLKGVREDKNNEKKEILKKFMEFKNKFKKTHPTDEEFLYRLKIFSSNLKMVNHINSLNLSYKLELNKYSELTFEEFKAIYLSPISEKPQFETQTSSLKKSSKDWRKSQDVSKVKNQMECGSCWAFSTTGSLESAYSIFKKKKIDLSEQELVDCSKGYGNYGCNGGMMYLAYDYIRDRGIGISKEYPYSGIEGKCGVEKTSERYHVGAYKQIQPINVLGLVQALDQQPVSAAIEVMEDFRFYKEGIYTRNDCGQNLNHGVLVVGYFSESDQPEENYFIVKNSWGEDWGDSGYIKMQIGNDNGICGIANHTDIFPYFFNDLSLEDK